VELVLADGGRHELRPTGDGHHEADIDLAAGTLYAFSLDGGPTLPDPRSRSQPHGVHGPSAVVAPASPPRETAWRGAPLRDRVLYELHVGAFTPEGTFDAVSGKLDHLVSLGVDAIELMPVAEFPGERGWGYDGVDLYAAYHGYGGPAGLDRLVSACHARGIAVILDVVYNHLGPDGNHLERFGPYFTDRYHTPWGKALNYDDVDSTPVRDHMIENALAWVAEHDIDGFRLDAIDQIFDRSAIPFVEELAARVADLARRLGRRVWVIAESDLNDPKVVRSPDAWGWGCDAQWSDDFHHAVHTVLTGERTGYYADFGQLADIAKALRDVYVYDGRWSSFRRRRHGRPFGDLPGHRVVVFAQDHDQVGNRARGERLVHLAGPARARIAAALLLLSPFVPMLFMGEEWGASAPFLYFTDHQEALGHAVREGRRHEFVRFGWDPGEIPDPQARETFERSRLDWAEISREPHRSLLEWHRALIALRRAVPELRDGRREAIAIAYDEAARWMRMVRGPITLAFALDRPADVQLDGRPGELALASTPDVDISDRAVHLPADGVAVIRA
jgi:maltooligosyltrehalose trehalohydrolase